MALPLRCPPTWPKPLQRGPLRRRLRRDPLDDTDASVRVERVLTEIFGA